MRLTSNAKRMLLGVGFVVLTLGILWSVKGTQPTTDEQSSVREVVEDLDEATVSKESLWSQLIPKTSVQKRDEVRAKRQLELSAMIENLHGVTKAMVVLSEEAGRLIGQAHLPMTACVTVEPLNPTLPASTVQAICQLIAGATLGLRDEDVTVINNRTGIVCSSDQFGPQPTHSTITRQDIEEALGLTVAVVSVTMENAVDGEFQIPWRSGIRPFIHISVPQSWVLRRMKQVGNQELVLSSIEKIVKSISPESRYLCTVVNDTPIALVAAPTRESYVKQASLIVGLLAILLSSVCIDRHRRVGETVRVVSQESPKQVAIRILQMEHSIARQVIDSLEGSHKIEVLHAIIAAGEFLNDQPLVQVPKQRQLELTRCG